MHINIQVLYMLMHRLSCLDIPFPFLSNIALVLENTPSPKAMCTVYIYRTCSYALRALYVFLWLGGFILMGQTANSLFSLSLSLRFLTLSPTIWRVAVLLYISVCVCIYRRRYLSITGRALVLSLISFDVFCIPNVCISVYTGCMYIYTV